jgi:hypothetical protein
MRFLDVKIMRQLSEKADVLAQAGAICRSPAALLAGYLTVGLWAMFGFGLPVDYSARQ